MKYALFEHDQNNLGVVNIGDHIQSCAAEQFLPRVDFYVKRETLNDKTYESAKIIMNGWFTDAPENWPPNSNLIPLFIAFHLQPKSAEIMFRKEENIAYLKKHEPIGCRDYKTLEILELHGIKAYFSFCLTTTLDERYRSDEKTENIYLVDPLYGYNRKMLLKVDPIQLLKKFPFDKLSKLKDYFKPKTALTDYVPQRIINKAEYVEHYVSAKKGYEELYNEAKSLLSKYARAKYVITSRIHCALPCLALGTPVLFLIEGLTDEKQHMSRFRGILDHINILTTQPKEEIEKIFGKPMNVYNPEEIDWNNIPKNPESFIELAEELKRKCRTFVDN